MTVLLKENNLFSKPAAPVLIHLIVAVERAAI